MKDINNMFKTYKRKGTAYMRDHIVGEDLSHVSVSQADIDAGYLDKPGSKIAMNIENPYDLWFVNKDYFEANFELDNSND